MYKGRNRLDGNFYAIKQILLDYADPELCQKTKNEAILLSRLQHAHIVRYYQAWTEDAPEDKRKYTLAQEDLDDDTEEQTN